MTLLSFSGVNGLHSFPVQVNTTEPVPSFKVNSPNVQYTNTHIIADYVYHNAIVSKNKINGIEVIPTETKYQFKTKLAVPKKVG